LSIYSQIGTDAVVNLGCKVRRLNLDLVRGNPIIQTVDFVGWKSETCSALTADPAVLMPSGIDNENFKSGFNTNTTSIKWDDESIEPIKEIHFTWTNTLKPYIGCTSPVPTKIEQVEGSEYLVGFLFDWDGSQHDLIDAVRDVLNFEVG
jgi:hypothetical protein